MSAMFASAGATGLILVVLGILSVLSWAIIVAKAVQLSRVRAGADRRAAAIAAWPEIDAAPALLTGTAPADRVLGFAMQKLANGHASAALASVLMQRGAAELARMTSMIRMLELTAMIAPLLGLLGTVLGMIQSFQQLELAEGAANASILAGGIWQALLTTAAGLLVAIPAAVGASLLAARAESGAQTIEAALSELMLAEEAQKATR